MCSFLCIYIFYWERRDVGADQISKIRWSDYKNPFSDLLFLDSYIDMTKYEKLRKVQCVPMRAVLEELDVTHVDIWVLDTEVRKYKFKYKRYYIKININEAILIQVYTCMVVWSCCAVYRSK